MYNLSNSIKKALPFLLITIIIFAFHSKLFLPNLSLYITPDYGRSDALSLSIADKYYYFQQLHQNKIPFWNQHIGTGYPTLAEGQTGIFFLPNMVLLRLLSSFPLAYNLLTVFSFITAASGLYLFCRSIKLGTIASLYGGLIFSLGSFFVFHVQHLHLIQTASILPWLLWTTNEYIDKKKITYLILFSLLLSQQIFAGFPQLVVYSLIANYFFLFGKLLPLKTRSLKTLFFVTFFVFLGLGISSIQLIPSYELLKISSRNIDPSKILNEFPYTPKNLLQFFNPYLLGTPKNASYAKWSPGSWGVYWESVAYVGKLPLIASIIALLLAFKKKTANKKIIWIFLILATLGILLSLGKFAPLHPLFSIPPLNLFRVPSRFLLITQLGLAVMAALVINRVKNKKVFIVVLSISVLDLFLYLYNYNPVGSSQKWLQPPITSTFLNKTSDRVVSIGQNIPWNTKLFQEGWLDTNYYYFARNSLEQNSNLIFNTNQFFTYESILTKRQSALREIVNNGIELKNDNIKLATNSANILTSQNVLSIITPYSLDNQNFEKVFQTDVFNNQRFNIYQSKNVAERAYIVTNFQIADTILEIRPIINDPNFNPQTKSVIEKDPKLNESAKATSWTTRIIEDEENKTTISAELNGDGMLILSDSYYPGWKAFDNGKEVAIIAANINDKAVALTAGKHTVKFVYSPSNLKTAEAISASSLLLLLIITLFLIRKRRISKAKN